MSEAGFSAICRLRVPAHFYFAGMEVSTKARFIEIIKYVATIRLCIVQEETGACASTEPTMPIIDLEGCCARERDCSAINHWCGDQESSKKCKHEGVG